MQPARRPVRAVRSSPALLLPEYVKNILLRSGFRPRTFSLAAPSAPARMPPLHARAPRFCPAPPALRRAPRLPPAFCPLRVGKGAEREAESISFQGLSVQPSSLRPCYGTLPRPPAFRRAAVRRVFLFFSHKAEKPCPSFCETVDSSGEFSSICGHISY